MFFILFPLVLLFNSQEVDRFDNSASNSLIDFINIFLLSSSRHRWIFLSSRRISLFITKQHRTYNNRVKFHTIILITSRYSSGMQQVAELAQKERFDQDKKKSKAKHSMSDENKMLCKMLLIIFNDFVIKIFSIIYVMCRRFQFAQV